MRSVHVENSTTAASLRALNYAPEVDAFRRGRSRHPSALLGELTASMGESFDNIFVRIDCDERFGVEMLSQADVLAAEPRGRFIRGDALPYLDDHRIKAGQILVAGTGTLGETEIYGRSIKADARLVGRIVGPNTLSITPIDPEGDLALYVYAFLLTKAGLRLVRATSYGTKLLRLRQDLLRRLPIPLADSPTTARVAALVRKSVIGRERYVSDIGSARDLLQSLPAMKAAHEMSLVRSRQCVAWKGGLPTLTAWTFASAGEALAHLRSEWRTRIGDIIEPKGIFRGGRYTRIKCGAAYGVDFLSQRDLFTVRQVPQHIVRPPVGDRLLYAPEHAIVAGGKGTLGEGEIFGRCVLVGPDLAPYALTEDILRIIPVERWAAVAYAFLSSQVGFRLLRSTASGTKLLTCREDLVSQLPFPEPGQELERAITLHVNSAVASRAEGLASEREAIRIIEEEVLPRWLT